MEAKRIYKGKDSKMTETFLGLIALFEQDLADFTACDPSLDAAFLAAWKVAWNNALSAMPDTVEVAEGEELLEKSVTALEKCRSKYKEVKYFAGRAFPANKEAMREFGEGTYPKVNNSRLRMVQFMEGLHGVATKYKTALIAQGYSQAAIDEIATFTDELREDNKAQQLKKKERPTETRKRIELLNTLYGFGQHVAQVAPLVFPNNPAKLNHLFLAQPRHQKVTKNWFTLAPADKRKIALTKLLKKFNVTLTNQGKETIEYWRADTIHEALAHKHFLDAEESVEVTPELPVKKFLIMQNASQKEVRVMWRKEEKEK